MMLMCINKSGANLTRSQSNLAKCIHNNTKKNQYSNVPNNIETVTVYKKYNHACKKYYDQKQIIKF